MYMYVLGRDVVWRDVRPRRHARIARTKGVPRASHIIRIVNTIYKLAATVHQKISIQRTYHTRKKYSHTSDLRGNRPYST